MSKHFACNPLCMNTRQYNPNINYYVRQASHREPLSRCSKATALQRERLGDVLPARGGRLWLGWLGDHEHARADWRAPGARPAV
eukprot:22637-Amphidinium_carterae.1